MDCPACGRRLDCVVMNASVDRVGICHVMIGITLAFKCGRCGYVRQDYDYIAYLKP